MHEALLRQYNLSGRYERHNQAVNRLEIAADGRIEKD
jgi:hypothetical protein